MRKWVDYIVSATPNANTRTIAQFLAAANSRVALWGVRLLPLGATSGSAPIIYEIGTQADAGTSSDDSANLIKRPPGFSYSIGTTVRNTFTAEPATTTVLQTLSLHQQGTLLWTPDGAPLYKGEPLIFENSARLGFRLNSSVGNGLAQAFEFYLEE